MQNADQQQTSLLEDARGSSHALKVNLIFDCQDQEDQKYGFRHHLEAYFDPVRYFVVQPEASDRCRLGFMDAQRLIH
jgi:hypothetical protein